MKPVLVKKALPRHWSKDFDTTEDLRNALRQARLMSLEDAKNIENIPLRPEIRDWELEQTAEGMKSIIPGIQGGKITDQGYVDEGGAFTYPAQLQSFLPLIHPEARMSGVTMPDIPGSMGKPSGRPSVLVGSFEKPEFHATQKEGRVQTEGFMPGGFDPSQAVLLTEPSRAFARQEVPMAIHNLVGGKMKDYAPGTFGYNEPVGRAMESFNILPHSTENPLSQYSGWGKPRTVDDEFRLSEPMDIAMRLLKEARPYALIPNFDLRHMLNPKSDIQGQLIMQHVPHALSNAESATEVYNQLMQEAKIREEETDYFPLPQTQIEDYGEQHPPIFRYNATNEVTYRPDFQDIYTGEPMDIAFQLLKEESEGQSYNEDLFEGLLDEDDHLHYDEMNDKQRAIIDAKAALPPHLFAEGSEMGENMNRFLFSRSMHEKIPDYHYDDELEYLQHFNNALQPLVNNREKTLEIMDNGDEEHPEHPHNVAMSRMHSDFKNRMNTIYRLYKASEPMDIAFQLLKERVSPEAKRHKLEYDKKYESSPERVKYREELNRERRRRGIYGSHDHKDISHTEGGKLTLEGEHENRARHFKDKGTLREL